MLRQIDLKELLEAGCHFGHQVSKSNPKAAEFVYTNRDKIQIIDLVRTKAGLEKAADFLKETVGRGGTAIFVGSKKQARNFLTEEAKRCGVFYIAKRWIGGLLTNWEEIKKNLVRMEELRDNLKSEKWTKKEKLLMERKLRNLKEIYGGIEGLTDRPQVLYIVDTHKDEGAVREANRIGIPVVGIVDTNADPTVVDWPIPANDDAAKSIQLITSYLADAVIEGRALAEKKKEEETEREEKTTEKKKVTKKTAKKTVPKENSEVAES